MRNDDPSRAMRTCYWRTAFLGMRCPPWPVIASILLLLTGCASQDRRVSSEAVPPEIARIPDAVPKVEPLAKSGNPDSYVVFGKRYYTQKSSSGHIERGLASWYGKPFHGRKTSSGEIYDMYGMTAAHKTLPLPTYAQVTNVENGRSVVVKINDRGPFHGPRIIDLSYTAAIKLGVVKRGTAKVEVRAIDPRAPKPDSSPFLAGHDAGVGPALAAETRGSARRERLEEPPRDRATAQTGGAQRPSDERQPVQSQADMTSRPSVSARALAAQGQPSRSRAQGHTLYLQIGAFGDQRNAERLRERLSSRLAEDPVQVLEPAHSGPPLYKVRIGPIASDQDADRIAQQLADLGVGTPHRIWN